MKNLKGLFNGIIGYGIFMIMGTAGASDLETLTFGQSVFKVLIAIVFISIGIFGKKALAKAVLEKLENESVEQNETELPLGIAS
jgi:hypothetical protein